MGRTLVTGGSGFIGSHVARLLAERGDDLRLTMRPRSRLENLEGMEYDRVEADVPWQGDDVVRMPDHPEVRVRELGPRELIEVPLDEIAELMRRLRAAHGVGDATGLKRAVLTAYGLVRLTARADEYLGLALDLAGEPASAP